MSSLISELKSARRILLLRLRSLGDSILTLPLIDALHAWRPDLAIDVLVEAPFAAVFLQHPAIHETLVVRAKRESSGPGWSRLKTVREIRKRRYAAVLNLHGGSTSLAFSLASGARIRIGQESYRQSWAYSVRIPDSSAIWGRAKLHTVEHQLSLLRWLGIPFAETPQLSLHVDPRASESVRRRLEAHGLEPGGFVQIHPAATLPTKQWPAERFAAVADALSQRYALPVVLTSGERETQVLEQARHAARRPHLYWSDLDLGGLLALIGHCRLFVGNDSGPTHAAAALGRPIVVIWGSSDYEAWHPWDARFEVVRANLPCQPCPGYACAAFDRPECILSASVAETLARCARLLSGVSEQRAR